MNLHLGSHDGQISEALDKMQEIVEESVAYSRKRHAAREARICIEDDDIYMRLCEILEWIPYIDPCLFSCTVTGDELSE